MRKRSNKSIDVKVIFDRKHTATTSSASKRRLGSVSIQVYYDKRKVFFQTGVKVYSDQFRNGRVYNTAQQGLLNERIKIILDSIENYINDTLKNDIPFKLDALRDYMNSVSPNDDLSFLDFMEKSINSRDIAESTRNVHLCVFRKLKTWGKIKSFKDINADNVAAWHNEAIKTSNKAKFNVSYDRILKVYIRLALKRNLITNDPYKQWSIPKYIPAQSHRSISIEDLRKIENIDLKKAISNKVRDLFLFQANTGLSYIDTQNFDSNRIRKSKGRRSYQNTRVKTNEIFYIPLNDAAERILKRYGGMPPKIILNTYNGDLRKIAKKAGVKLPISSHWARHTFAMICLNNGMPIEVLATIMGHSNIKTTQIYAKIKQSTIDREFDKVMNNIEKGG